MSVLKRQLFIKNQSGEYDQVMLQTTSEIVLRPNGNTLEQDLTAYLPTSKADDVIPATLTHGLVHTNNVRPYVGLPSKVTGLITEDDRCLTYVDTTDEEEIPGEPPSLDGLKEQVDELSTKVDQCFTSVSEGKALVAAAVTDKGVQSAADATFKDFADNISKISTGVDVSDATAYAMDLVAGKVTYTNIAGRAERIVGTIQQRSSTDIYTSNGYVYVPAGHYSSTCSISTGSTQVRVSVDMSRYEPGPINDGKEVRIITDSESAVLKFGEIYAILVSSGKTFAVVMGDIGMQIEEETLDGLEIVKSDYIGHSERIIYTMKTTHLKPKMVITQS